MMMASAIAGKDRVILAILYITAFIASVNNNIVNVALPDIAVEYGVDAVATQWLISGYTIMSLISATSMAFLYRRFSTRTIFFTTQLILIVTGIGCLLAPSFPFLLVARVAQGIGAGMSMPLMMNGVLAIAPLERRGFYMGLGSTIITLAPAITPVFSGAITTLLSWHAVFLVPISISALMFVMGLLALHNLTQSEHIKFDAPSAVILAAGLVCVAFGLTRIMSNTPLACALLVVGAAIIALFARRQRRLETPYLVLEPLRRVAFWPCCVMALITIMSTFSFNLLIPLYLEDGISYSALTVGVILLVAVLFNTVSGFFAGALLDRFGAWPLIPIGYVCIVAGQACFNAVAMSYFIPGVIAGACLVCVGIGLTSSPSQVTGLNSLEEKLYPHGVSITTAFVQLAGCLAPTLYVGVMNTTQAAAQAAGASVAEQMAIGFRSGECAAIAVSVFALVLSIVYTQVIQKRRLKGKL